MGFSSRDKLHRSGRKSRSSAKRDHRHQAGAPAATEAPELAAATGGDANPSPAELGFSTEEQLEEMLMSSLEMLYGEAVSRLVSLGYDEEVAMTSVLRNGHCYGSLDVLTNVLENALTIINGDGDGGGGGGQGFGSLRQLQEYTLAGMVCWLQQVRPQLSRAEAMWCLLMSDLDLGRASTIEMPNRSPPPTTAAAADHRYDCGSVDGVCELHIGWGGAADLAATGSAFDASAVMDFAAVRASEIECPKRFNLSPKMESLLKRNVAIFAAGFRACSKKSNPCNDEEEGCISVALPKIEDGIEAQSADVVDSVLDSLGNLSMNDKHEGQVDLKDEMILNLMHQIRELEVQLKERREWAHQKALQAAKKLSNDLTELKTLRMEREETLRLKKGKQALEDSTMKKLSEMENALKKASSQVDLANAAIRRLEIENAEMRAEREASRLSASESVNTCLEVAKREKKCLKRLLNWEKQKVKLEEEIKTERENIEQLQHQIVQVMEAQKETEVFA